MTNTNLFVVGVVPCWIWTTDYCWEEILHQLVSSLSHYLQGFIDPGFLPSTVSTPWTSLQTCLHGKLTMTIQEWSLASFIDLDCHTVCFPSVPSEKISSMNSSDTQFGMRCWMNAKKTQPSHSSPRMFKNVMNQISPCTPLPICLANFPAFGTPRYVGSAVNFRSGPALEFLRSKDHTWCEGGQILPQKESPEN